MIDLETSMQEQDVPTPPAGVATPGLGRRLLAGLPTLLVVAGLAVLGFWGHHTGWKLPKASDFTGRAPGAQDDWCQAHAVPESLCVECTPGLLPRGKEHGVCKAHRVAECPLCYPDVAQLRVAPRLTAADFERAQRGLAFAERPENDRKCKKHLRRLQFASQAAADKAGVEVDVAVLAPVVETVAGNGEITFDQSRVARLSSRLPGTVWRVERQVGDAVKQGDVLALVDAAEVGKAKAEFLQALAQVDVRTRTLESMRPVGVSGAMPERLVRDAEAALREARIRLLSARQALVNLGMPVQVEELAGLKEEALAQRIQFLGLPEALGRALDARTVSANLLPIKAPGDGTIVNRDIVAGEVVDAAKVLFVVADVRSLWLDLNVRSEDARRLKLGQTVHFRQDGQAASSIPWYTVVGDKLTWNRSAEGTISWISPAVDERTRTVKARAELANADGRWRAGTFGAGRVVLREELGVLVPKEAVQWEGCCHVVFVQDRNYHVEGAPKVYHVRKVIPGANDDRRIEVIAGVLPGEVVAARGAGVLRAELLKNDLGDG
jgi:cobalt-zinc-cadmium efflux system membrane fusion protein